MKDYKRLTERGDYYLSAKTLMQKKLNRLTWLENTIECGEIDYVADKNKEIARLTEENAELQKRLDDTAKTQYGWISVEERLPEIDNGKARGFDVMVYIPKRDGYNQHGVYIGKLSRVNADNGTENFWGTKTDSCDWMIWGWSYLEHPIVTHWKPLPHFPVGAETRLAERKGGEK